MTLTKALEKGNGRAVYRYRNGNRLIAVRSNTGLSIEFSDSPPPCIKYITAILMYFNWDVEQSGLTQEKGIEALLADKTLSLIDNPSYTIEMSMKVKSDMAQAIVENICLLDHFTKNIQWARWQIKDEKS